MGCGAASTGWCREAGAAQSSHSASLRVSEHDEQKPTLRGFERLLIWKVRGRQFAARNDHLTNKYILPLAEWPLFLPLLALTLPDHTVGLGGQT